MFRIFKDLGGVLSSIVILGLFVRFLFVVFRGLNASLTEVESPVHIAACAVHSSHHNNEHNYADGTDYKRG